MLSQIFAVTGLGLRTIPQRLGSSLVAVVGITGVVVVLVAVLSIAEGFQRAMKATGAPDRAIVMRAGADTEMVSGLTGANVDVIKQAPGILHHGQLPIASAEMFVIVDVNKRSTGTAANVPLRGIDSTALDVRPEVKIVQGRMLTFGTDEAIVGRAAVAEFEGLDLGSAVKSGSVMRKIVGVFASDGSIAETEIWTDVHGLQAAYQRGNSYQSVLVRLDSSASYDGFKAWLTSNPQVEVQPRRESEYYAQQSEILTMVVRVIGFGIAGLMGIGATFGAVLTMYTAVATRTREIATLRALGFGTLAVVVSVLFESIVLAAGGAAIGGFAAFAAFNGYQAATMNWQSFSQVAFQFAVTPKLIGLGFAIALVMGLIGGLLPAIRAALLPIPSALREL
jgi:putative ABC transport system permease protein